MNLQQKLDEGQVVVVVPHLPYTPAVPESCQQPHGGIPTPSSTKLSALEDLCIRMNQAASDLAASWLPNSSQSGEGLPPSADHLDDGGVQAPGAPAKNLTVIVDGLSVSASLAFCGS